MHKGCGRKRSGGSWRPVVGVVGGCLLAYGISLQGSTNDGSVTKISINQDDLAASPSSLESTLQTIAPSKPSVARGGGRVFSPRTVLLDGEEISFGRVTSIVAAGGTPQQLNMDSGSASFYAAEGGSCSCDADCPIPISQCSRANCLNGACRELFRPINAWCDLDSTWCTQDRCDGGGTCQARTLSRCVHECDDASTDSGNTCISTGSCHPGQCVAVGVCNEAEQRCELSPDVGRCCSGATSFTCAYISQTACDGLSGMWLRIADTDDTDDSCFCPTFSAGIVQNDQFGVDLGPVRPPFEVCFGALHDFATGGDPLDPIRRCIDPALDCAKRCVGGTNLGKICTSDPDCPSSSCGFDVCVDEPNHCHAGFQKLGDDYKMVNGSYLRLKQLRIHGGVENSREILTFQFYDNAEPPQLVDQLAFIFNTRGSGNDFITFDFDCAPDCNVPRNESARSEPFIIPPQGWVVMRTIRNLGQNASGGTQEPGEFGNGHWVDTDAVDVGDVVLANDPTMLWIDGGPTSVLPPGASGILSFELLGEPILDPRGACCNPDIPGACVDNNIWQCRECTREANPNRRPCSESRDCGPLDFCFEPNWHGPRTQSDVAGNVTDLCEGDICNSGSCCLPDGSCQVTDPATCEDAAGLNGTFTSPGGSCDPNCCEQTLVTGGDCCGDINLCENGGSTREDEDCLTDADCDQDLGRCTDGKVCVISLNSCTDGSTCTGPNTCSFCKGAVDTVLEIPTFLLGPNDPNRTVRKTLTGTTKNTFFGRDQGDTCTRADTDIGVYEKFSFQGHCETDFFSGTGGPPCSFDSDCDQAAFERCVGGCAVVTVSWCCSAPLFSPVWPGLLDVTDTCECDLSEMTVMSADLNTTGQPRGGFGSACNHDDEVDNHHQFQDCCADGNFSSQVTLPSGEYLIQVATGKFCENSVLSCVTDDDCIGVPCTVEGQKYQLHITVESCRIAACCLNIPCTTDADCEIYTSLCNTTHGFCESSCMQTSKLECEGNILNGIVPDIPGNWLGDLDPPIAVCSTDGLPENNFCRRGTCCTGPGECNDESFNTLHDCLTNNFDNVYHGGVTCLDTPCPVCPFRDPAHCQANDPAGNTQNSDRHLGRRLVDDIRVPANDILDRVCWWGCWAPPQFPQDLPACWESPPNNNEDWQIVFYHDSFGFPDESSAVVHNVIPDAVAPIDGLTCWDMSAEISPPMQVTAGECLWVEITGNGTATCNASLFTSADGNSFSYRDADGTYGEEDLDASDYNFCVSSGLTPGSTPREDGGCGDLTGACCTIDTSGSPPTCEDNPAGLGTRSACNEAQGSFFVGTVCQAVICPNPANDLCENAEPVCGLITVQDPPDPDIAACFGDPDQPCLKSAAPGQVGSCVVLGNDLGPCFNLPIDATSARCSFQTDNRLAGTDGPTNAGTDCLPSGSQSFQADVWYTMNSPCTGRMHVNMCGAATYDGMLTVYGDQTPTCVTCPIANNVQHLQCNDDFCDGAFSTASAVTVDVIKDACYTFRVGGWSQLGKAFDGGQSISTAEVIITCDPVSDANTPLLPGVVDGVDHNIQKQRYLSINPNNPAITRMRVSLLNLRCNETGKLCASNSDCKVCDSGSDVGNACSFDFECSGGGSCVVSGESCDEQSSPVNLGWVGDPVEAGGDAPPGTFVSPVVSFAPPGRGWNEPVIHIADCEIAPGRTYAIIAEDSAGLFSDPLVIGTTPTPSGKAWGDIVGNFNGVTWTAPNGLVSFDDISAIRNFLILGNAPHITVVDLVGGFPTFVNTNATVTDLQVIFKAFSFGSYPPLVLLDGGYPDLLGMDGPVETLLDCPAN